MMRSVIMAASLFAIGCGGSGGKSNTDGSSSNDDLSSSDKLVAVTGVITATSNGGGSPPTLANATVSISGTTTSTTTAADGSFTLMAAEGSTIFVNATLANYVTSEWGFVVPGSGGEITNTQMISTANLMSVISGLNPALTIDKTKGDVIVQFHDGAGTGTAGYSASLSASHGNSFSPDNGMYTSTTPGGSDSDNPLVFPNVVAGTTTVMVTAAAGKTCTPEGSILDWRVDPATFTWIRYTCQ